MSQDVSEDEAELNIEFLVPCVCDTDISSSSI